jgi:hypothetical protein
MTRTRGFLIVFVMVIALAVIFARFLNQSTTEVTKSKDKATNEAPATAERKLIGVPPEKEKEVLEHLTLRNSISPEWEDKLTESLKAQGGDAVTNIQIKKVASLIWVQNGSGINVESVVITIKGKAEEESLFKALVDSQTGKILETWDRPVVDPINPRKAFRLKVDPRYFNQ